MKTSLSDPEFNPRDEQVVAVAKVVQSIKEPKSIKVEVEKPKLDLLALQDDHSVSAKVLTPAAETAPPFEELLYSDPFDTSIASNILPGEAELKLLETELIHTAHPPIPKPAAYTFPDTVVEQSRPSSDSNVPDLFEDHDDGGEVDVKPLSPVTGRSKIFISYK